MYKTSNKIIMMAFTVGCVGVRNIALGNCDVWNVSLSWFRSYGCLPHFREGSSVIVYAVNLSPECYLHTK